MTHPTTYFKTPRKARSGLLTSPINGKRPFRRLIATLAAGVAALSLMVATAIPAHADRQSDTLAKALIAALAIGAIVHSTRPGKSHPTPAPAPVPKPVRHSVVPSVCAIEVNGARRDAVFYPEGCLRAEGFDYRLPRDCAISLRIRGRVDRAYGERCLCDAGFRIADQGRHDEWRRDDRGYGNGLEDGLGRERFGY